MKCFKKENKAFVWAYLLLLIGNFMCFQVKRPKKEDDLHTDEKKAFL